MQEILPHDVNLLYDEQHDVNGNGVETYTNDNGDDDDDNDSEDDDGNVTIAAPPPPVAAARSTLKSHYVATKPTSMLSRTAPSRLVHRLPALKASSDSAANVQVVLLQNQVDTLQWQLKQAFYPLSCLSNDYYFEYPQTYEHM
ncbi:unnamed protein product [Ceratitis capitata]|uniref:(Mediterranean fruit fly) hypothetical protein n=1 Tax=Ceratitis capitata TaxID=7213 RepID=A0A811UUW0_CERCA|nr:unnamed protein product [Ceratitis capitata]